MVFASPPSPEHPHRALPKQVSYGYRCVECLKIYGSEPKPKKKPTKKGSRKNG